MKNYKLVKEDSRSFLVHDGKEAFHVAKHPLGPDLHKKIRGLPAYAEGGEIGAGAGGEDDSGSAIDNFVNSANSAANDVSAAATPAINNANQVANTEGASAGPIPEPARDIASATEPAPAAETSAPAASPSAASIPMPNMSGIFKDIQGAQGQQLAGVKAGADVQAAKANEDAETYKYFNNLMQKSDSDSKATMSQLDAESADLQKAYASQKMDPNRLWHNASTGSKIGAAIAMIFSGIGAGMSGQQNMAMAVIQKNIDRDIEAQKMDQSKTMNLYKFNRDRYRDALLAEQATRLHITSALQGQLAATAAKFGGPQAQANAQQAIGQLRIQQDQIKMQMGQSLYQQNLGRALLGGGGVGGAAQMEPSKRILGLKMTGLIDEKQQMEMMKELNDAKNHSTQVDSILQAFDKAAQENTVAGRAGRAGFAPPSIAELQTAIMPYLKDAEGRINEMELERTDKLMPGAGSKDATVAEQRKGLVKFLNEKRPNTGLLDAYNIDTSKFGAMNEQGQNKYKLGPIVKGR